MKNVYTIFRGNPPEIGNLRDLIRKPEEKVTSNIW
jgi:hypothetical protein